MKPQYARLQIGIVEGETSVIHSRIVGEISKVPYAEPTWLSDGYFSPYYTEVLLPSYRSSESIIKPRLLQNHRNFQKALRKFVDEIINPDAIVSRLALFMSLPST